jgi:hypothetical protein
MADVNFVIRNGLTVNGSFVANSSVVNAAAIAATSLTIGVVTANATTINVGTTTINSTTYTGLASTANNASFLGGTAAASYLTSASLSGYQTTAGLSANVATLTANNSSFLGGTAAASYQTTAGLSANVAAAGYTNTSGAYTITGVRTHSANVIINGNVGIGTSTLNNRLSIKNDANNSVAMVYTENANTGANAFSGVIANSGGVVAKLWSTASTGAYGGTGTAALGTDTATPLLLFSNGANRIVLAANGNIDLATMPTNSGLPTFGVRAWAAYNGQTDSLLAGGNITVTKIATGHYRFNFTTAMPDTLYAVTTGLGDIANPGSERADLSVGRTTGYFDVQTWLNSTDLGDVNYIAVTVVR